VLDYDGEEKLLREFEEDGLSMQMVEPFRSDLVRTSSRAS